jgi:hypothetical protein
MVGITLQTILLYAAIVVDPGETSQLLQNCKSDRYGKMSKVFPLHFVGRQGYHR